MVVAEGDKATCAALRQPSYATLITDGGALDELLREVESAEVAAAEAVAAAAAVAEAAEAAEDEDPEDAAAGSKKRKRRRNRASHHNADVSIISQRGALAANLAATLLRGAFAAAPPLAFVRHVTDECGTGGGARARRDGGGNNRGCSSSSHRATSGYHRFEFERGWECTYALGDRGVADSEGLGRRWRLGAMLATAWGVNSGGGVQPPRSPEPSPYGGGIHVKKRARVVL